MKKNVARNGGTMTLNLNQQTLELLKKQYQTPAVKTRVSLNYLKVGLFVGVLFASLLLVKNWQYIQSASLADVTLDELVKELIFTNKASKMDDRALAAQIDKDLNLERIDLQKFLSYSKGVNHKSYRDFLRKQTSAQSLLTTKLAQMQTLYIRRYNTLGEDAERWILFRDRANQLLVEFEQLQLAQNNAFKNHLKLQAAY